MRKVNVLGIDLAKNVFQLHGLDLQGNVVLKKKLRRGQLTAFIANLQPCLIGIEACSGSHYWARAFSQYGHNVKIMAPQYVKPYVKTNKNDMADAEAIAEAVTRKNMRFVPLKTIASHDLQSLHRARKRLVRNITALSNEVRGLLTEYGHVFPVGKKAFKQNVIRILKSDSLSNSFQKTLQDLYSEYLDLNLRLDEYNKRISKECQENPVCQKLLKVKGIGELTATALAIVDPHVFKNGREFAAWLGLTPRQFSSGSKDRLLGISKRGDGYIRQLLVHGSRVSLHWSSRKNDHLSIWASKLKDRRGYNKATVALANKLARICWAVMKYEKDFTLSY